MTMIARSNPAGSATIWTHLANSPEQSIQKSALSKWMPQGSEHMTADVIDNVFKFIGPDVNVFFVRFTVPLWSYKHFNGHSVGITTVVIPTINTEHAAKILSAFIFSCGVFSRNAFEVLYRDFVEIAHTTNPFLWVERSLKGTAMMLETKQTYDFRFLRLDIEF